MLGYKIIRKTILFQYIWTVFSLYNSTMIIQNVKLTFWDIFIFQNLAAAAAAGGIGVRPSFATGMAGIPHAATGLSLQAAIANQAAYGQALPAT